MADTILWLVLEFVPDILFNPPPPPGLIRRRMNVSRRGICPAGTWAIANPVGAESPGLSTNSRSDA